MQYNLLDFVTTVADPRRGQGQRHPLWAFLAMVVLAILSGHNGLRSMVRFMHRHEETFTFHFGLKHGVPSFGTTRTLLCTLDQEDLAKRFRDWMAQFLPAQSEVWIALDGKALASTVEDPHGAKQRFVFTVHAFAQHSGLVHAMSSFTNGKAHEAQAVRELIQHLKLEQAVYTLDALHCQKKR